MNPYLTESLEFASPEVDEVVEKGLSAHVILFNDDEHTFDEVALQIVLAIGCDFDRALDLTFQVHSNGSAMVFEGELVACLNVSSVLEEIALTTEIAC